MDQYKCAVGYNVEYLQDHFVEFIAAVVNYKISTSDIKYLKDNMESFL